jgi:hypothetical protein
MKQKVIIDPDKVIKVEPRKVKTPSPLFMGFFYGWTSFYLLYKILEHLK